MRRGGINPGAGRPKKGDVRPIPQLAAALADPKQRKSAKQWCSDAINDPSKPDELKYKIAAILLPYESPRVEKQRIGKKELQAQAALEARSDARFAPGAPPTLSIVPPRKDN